MVRRRRTLTVWPDLWLNEGFARFSEWIYNERHGGETAQAAFERVFARGPSSAVWSFPAAAPPDAASLFGTPPYDRGAMTLQALRVKVGDPVFFDIVRSWYQEHKYGNATTDDFIALAESKSGLQLGDFFELWLYTAGKPAPGSW